MEMNWFQVAVATFGALIMLGAVFAGALPSVTPPPFPSPTPSTDIPATAWGVPPWIFTTTKSTTHSQIWDMTINSVNRLIWTSSSCTGTSCSIVTGATDAAPKDWNCTNYNAGNKRCEQWTGIGTCGTTQAYDYHCTLWDSTGYVCKYWSADQCAGGVATVSYWNCGTWNHNTCSEWEATFGTGWGCQDPYTCVQWNGDWCSRYAGTGGMGYCYPAEFVCTGCQDACYGCTEGCRPDFACNYYPVVSNLNPATTTGQKYPHLSIIPITWSVYDANGDSVTTNIEFSNDSGVSWYPISTCIGVSGSTCNWDASTVNTYNNYLLRANATDSYGYGNYAYSAYPFSIYTPVTDCGLLSGSNQDFVLAGNIAAIPFGIDCIFFDGSNVTIDCNGYSINYSEIGGNDGGAGIMSTGTPIQTNAVIKNCNTYKTNPYSNSTIGIWFNFNVTNSTIQNNSVFIYGDTGTNNYGLGGVNSSYMLVTNNAITVSGTATAIDITSNYSTVSNNVVMLLDSASRAFWSEWAETHDSVVTNLLINNVNTSFTWFGAITISNASTPPTDPTSYYNISKWLNITNSSEAWIALNISYTPTDLGTVNESTLSLWNYDGANWTQVVGSGVDTTNNYVYGNVTSFSIIAPLGFQQAPNIIIVNPINTYYTVGNLTSNYTLLGYNSPYNCTSFFDGAYLNSQMANNGSYYSDIIPASTVGSHNYTVNCTDVSNVSNATTVYFTSINPTIAISCFDEQTGADLTCDFSVTNGTQTNTSSGVHTFSGDLTNMPNGFLTIGVSKTDFYPRIYHVFFTTTDVNVSAYLLNQSVTAIFVRFHVRNLVGQGIVNASILVERMINGTLVPVSSLITDGIGDAADYFELNHLYAVVVTATGYNIFYTSISMTQNDYTITLIQSIGNQTNQTGYGNYSLTNTFEDVWWTLIPYARSLANGTSNNFSFIVASPNSSLSYWGMEVNYSNGTNFCLLNSTSASGGILTCIMPYSTSLGDNASVRVWLELTHSHGWTDEFCYRFYHAAANAKNTLTDWKNAIIKETKLAPGGVQTSPALAIVILMIATIVGLAVYPFNRSAAMIAMLIILYIGAAENWLAVKVFSVTLNSWVVMIFVTIAVISINYLRERI